MTIEQWTNNTDYLVLPVPLVKQMDKKWQNRLANLLEEMDEELDINISKGKYFVSLKDKDGNILKDPF